MVLGEDLVDTSPGFVTVTGKTKRTDAAFDLTSIKLIKALIVSLLHALM